MSAAGYSAGTGVATSDVLSRLAPTRRRGRLWFVTEADLTSPDVFGQIVQVGDDLNSKSPTIEGVQTGALSADSFLIA